MRKLSIARLAAIAAALLLPLAAQAQQTDIRPKGTTTVTGTVAVSSVAGTVATTATATGNVASGAADSGNPVKMGGRYNTTQPTLTDGQRGDVQLGPRGEVLVKIVSNTATLSDTNGVFTVPKPVTSGGLTLARLVAATNGVIKNSAGQLYTGQFTNTNAAIRYLQIYNKATAGTLSTDTPVATIPLPPNVPVPVNFTDIGGAFATGISWQFTTDDVAIPTTAGAATDIHGFVTYK